MIRRLFTNSKRSYTNMNKDDKDPIWPYFTISIIAWYFYLKNRGGKGPFEGSSVYYKS